MGNYICYRSNRFKKGDNFMVKLKRMLGDIR